MRKKRKREREKKKRNNVLSHVPNLCNHILVNGVIWLLTERRIRWERERERERREKIKIYWIIKRTTCCPSLSLNTCRMWSAVPAATGWTSVTTHSRTRALTHTHTNTCRVTPQISTFKEKKRTVYCCWKRHTIRRICTHSADHLPSLPDSPETLTLTFGLVSTCQTEHALCFVFFLFFFFLKKKKKRQGCLNFHFLDPLASSRSSNALIRDLTWLPMISHQNHP